MRITRTAAAPAEPSDIACTETPFSFIAVIAVGVNAKQGASFALNAMIEADRVLLLHGDLELIDTPTQSGKGQKIFRCAKCRVAVWSHYSGAGDTISFVRVGTLEEPDSCPPDVHIFTDSKQPWVVIPENARAFKEYYRSADLWPPESLARRAALQGKSRPQAAT